MAYFIPHVPSVSSLSRTFTRLLSWVLPTSWRDRLGSLLSYGRPHFVESTRVVEDQYTYAAFAGNLADISAYLADMRFLGLTANSQDQAGSTLLAIASISGQLDVTVALLACGAFVDAPSDVPALKGTCVKGYRELVDLLLLANADVSGGAYGGQTALHLVSLAGRLDIVHALLRHGADLNQRTTEMSCTPLDKAVYGEKVDVMIELLVEGGRFGMLDFGSPYLCSEVKAVLVVNAILSTEMGVGGGVTMMCAAQLGFLDMATALLQHGADPNKPNPEAYMNRPIQPASYYGYVDLIELLLISGANENALGAEPTIHPLLQAVGLPGVAVRVGESPLKGSLEAAQMLLHIGVDADQRYDLGKGTALHFAQTTKMIDLLVSYGADLDARNDDGQTPIEFALARGRMPIVQRLESHHQLRVKLYSSRLGLVQWLPNQPESSMKIALDLKAIIGQYVSLCWADPPPFTFLK